MSGWILRRNPARQTANDQTLWSFLMSQSRANEYPIPQTMKAWVLGNP
jgi:hypothetical protein